LTPCRVAGQLGVKGRITVARRTWELAAIAAAIGVAAIASASETINYSYDARGRLVKVVRTGTINNGVNTSYTYDKADNRTNVTVAGSSNPPPP
jgi:YD repeat-containing protein